MYLQHMELEVFTCQRELWLVIEYKKAELSSDPLSMVVKSSHLAGYGLEALLIHILPRYLPESSTEKDSLGNRGI